MRIFWSLRGGLLAIGTELWATSPQRKQQFPSRTEQFYLHMLRTAGFVFSFFVVVLYAPYLRLSYNTRYHFAI
jgi:hypothetical protein